DSANGATSHQTPWGTFPPLHDGNIRDLPFVTGFALRLHWEEMENPDGSGQYDFFIMDYIIGLLPSGQHLSVTIGGAEPVYIASHPGVTTWNDGGLLRAVPWDPYLRARRQAFVAALANHQVGAIP